MSRIFIEIIGLQTPKGRLIFFAVVSIAVFIAPYHLLSELSLWQRIGLENALSVGLTRSYWHILHLDPQAAWHRNPLIFAVLAIGLPLLIKDAYALKNKQT